MKASQVLSVSVITLALAMPLGLMARADGDGTVAVSAGPTTDHVTTSKLVYGLLSDSRYAYRPRALDAAMSADIFKRYLESLDGARVLTAQDVARFDGSRAHGESARPRHKPAFEMYASTAAPRRVGTRALLKQDIFDFEGDERWYYDREDAEWATSGAELDELWKKSVRNDWLRLKLAGKEPAEIRKTLDKRYANIASNVTLLNREDAFQTFLNAYTSSIDPHTDYFNPRTAGLFNQSMSLSLEGIGAQLQKQDDVVVIRELIAGGPAATSNKFTPGDRIVGVGQGRSGPMEDVIGWRIDDVVEKIKGKAGTQVRLDVVPVEAVLDSAPVRITLTRAKVRLEEQAAKSKVLDIPGVQGAPAKRIGVIELPAFYQDFEGRRSRDGDYASATRDVARILGTFRTQAVDGVVLDLRSNGGGSLNEAVELTGLFIDQGPVVQVRESGGRVGVESDRTGGVSWDGPLAVLVNRGSASASEIVAGAIQDYGRGLVIGENTSSRSRFKPGPPSTAAANDGKRYGLSSYPAQFFLPAAAALSTGLGARHQFPVRWTPGVRREHLPRPCGKRIASVPHPSTAISAASAAPGRAARPRAGEGPRFAVSQDGPSSAPSPRRITSRSTTRARGRARCLDAKRA